MSDKPKYAILFHTTDYRGDHSADICRVIAPIEGETIDALIARIKLGENSYGGKGDYIAIRLVERPL